MWNGNAWIKCLRNKIIPLSVKVRHYRIIKFHIFFIFFPQVFELWVIHIDNKRLVFLSCFSPEDSVLWSSLIWILISSLNHIFFSSKQIMLACHFIPSSCKLNLLISLQCWSIHSVLYKILQNVYPLANSVAEPLVIHIRTLMLILPSPWELMYWVVFSLSVNSSAPPARPWIPVKAADKTRSSGRYYHGNVGVRLPWKQYQKNK